MGALLSFLGGSVFRMLFGEIASYFQKKQDYAHELLLMEKQGELEDKRAERMQAGLAQQAALNIQTINVQGEQDIARLEAGGWATAVGEALKPTGNYVVDLWNGIIRPMAASISLFLWVVALNKAGWTMTEWDKELVGVILGFFFASRVMAKMGK